MALAKDTKDAKGVNWEKYYANKAKAGFAFRPEWNFFDSREIFVQIDSQWLKPYMKENECIWFARVEGIGNIVLTNNTRLTCELQIITQ